MRRRLRPTAPPALDQLEPRTLLAAAPWQVTPAVLSAPRGGFAATTVGDTAIFAGGDKHGSFGDVVDLYDGDTGRWSTARLSQAREAPAAVSVDGKALFAGGDLPGGATSDVVDVYDAASGQWAVAHLSQARHVYTAVTAGDDAIFAGGYVSDGRGSQSSDAFDLYDARTGQWSSGRLPFGGSLWAGVTGHRAVFFDGQQTLDIFDADTGQWSLRQLPSIQQVGAQFAVIANKAVFYGGLEADGVANVYDLTSSTLTDVALPGATRSVFTTVGTKLIFAGGTYEDGGAIARDTVNVYDAATDQWSSGTMPQAIIGQAAVTVGTRAVFTDGEVAETYDTASGEWSLVKLGLAPAYSGAQAATAGGRVLVTDPRSAAIALLTPSTLPPPVAPSPAAGGGLAAAPGGLAWQPAPGATGYDVYLDEALVATTSDPRWAADRPLANGSHSWQVVARDAGQFTAGPRWTFTIGAPAAPAGPTPGDGAALATPPPRLSWAPSAGATGYDLYLDGARHRHLTSSDYEPPAVLTGGTHTWAVVARNGYAATVGPTWTFTTPAAHLARHGISWRRTQSYATPAAVAVGDVALFATGTELAPSRLVREYDAATDRWSTLAMSTARSGVAATAAGHVALFAGGYDPASRRPSDVVDLYDVATRRWSAARLSSARRDLVAAAAGHVALFAGGNHSDAVDLYDATTHRWRTAKLSQARDVGSVTVVGTKVLFAGGSAPDTRGVLHVSDVVDIYDAATDAWSTARLSQARAGIAATTAGNFALFAGGTDANGAATDLVDAYDANTGRWFTMHLSRRGYGITAAAVGHMAFFAGGIDSDAVDVFNARTGRWSMARLAAPRVVATAVTLGTRVIFAGDANAYDAGPSVVDVCDVASGTWSVTATSLAAGSIAAVTAGNRAVLFGFAYVRPNGASYQGADVLAPDGA